MSQEYVIVLTTLPADSDGAAFARDLVEERLAACVNLSAPMESFYRWEGTVESESERQLVIKTTAARLSAACRGCNRAGDSPKGHIRSIMPSRRGDR